LAHFPPLAASAKGASTQQPGSTRNFVQFDREDLISIVSSMDMTKQTGPPFVTPANCPIVLSTPVTKLVIVPNQHRKEESSPSERKETTDTAKVESTPIPALVVEDGQQKDEEPPKQSPQKKRRANEKKRTAKAVGASDRQQEEGSAASRPTETDQRTPQTSPTYAQIVRPRSPSHDSTTTTTATAST